MGPLPAVFIFMATIERLALETDAAGTDRWDRIAGETIAVYEAVCGRAGAAGAKEQSIAQTAGARTT